MVVADPKPPILIGFTTALDPVPILIAAPPPSTLISRTPVPIFNTPFV